MNQHSFSVELGTAYGVYEALFLMNLYFWLKMNLIKRQQIFDGKVWAEFPLRKVMERQPYFTESSLRTVIKNLKNNKMIIMAKKQGRNILSYTLTDQGWSTMLKNDFTKEKSNITRELERLNPKKLKIEENKSIEIEKKEYSADRTSSLLEKIKKRLNGNELINKRICKNFGTIENFIENIIGPSVEEYGKNIVDRAFENFMRKASNGGSYSLVATFYEEIKYMCEK